MAMLALDHPLADDDEVAWSQLYVHGKRLTPAALMTVQTSLAGGLADETQAHFLLACSTASTHREREHSLTWLAKERPAICLQRGGLSLPANFWRFTSTGKTALEELWLKALASKGIHSAVVENFAGALCRISPRLVEATLGSMKSISSTEKLRFLRIEADFHAKRVEGCARRSRTTC